MILPKKHADNLYELPEETAQKVLPVAQKIAKLLNEKLGCDGLNLVQNNGEIAGQSVMHFHMHLIPRFRDDGQRILWKPTQPNAAELDGVLETIRG